MQTWEKGVGWLRERIWLYHGLCIVFCGLIFYAGVSNAAMPVKKLGKSLGTPAAYLGGACLAYYLLRELFVRCKRNAWQLPIWLESFWKNVLKVLRLLHPLLGILAFYLVLLHGSLLLWAGAYLRSVRMVSGLTEGVLVFVLLISGGLLVRRAQLRKWHRFIAAAILLLFLVHLYIKLRF